MHLFASLRKRGGDGGGEKGSSSSSYSSHNNSNNDSSSASNGDIKIGTPTNFKHNIQVKHDKERNQFIGLPDEWRHLLEKNNIKLISFFVLFLL